MLKMLRYFSFLCIFAVLSGCSTIGSKKTPKIHRPFIKHRPPAGDTTLPYIIIKPTIIKPNIIQIPKE